MHKDFLASTTNAYKFKFSLLGIIFLCAALIVLIMHLNMLALMVSILFVLFSLFCFLQGYRRSILLQKDKIIERRGLLFSKVIDRKMIDHVTIHTSFVNSDSSESEVKILQIFDKNNNLIQKLDSNPYSKLDLEHLVKLLNRT